MKCLNDETFFLSNGMKVANPANWDAATGLEGMNDPMLGIRCGQFILKRPEHFWLHLFNLELRAVIDYAFIYIEFLKSTCETSAFNQSAGWQRVMC